MFGLSFNPFSSKTIWGTLGAVVSYLASQPHITWQSALGALSVIVGVTGVRDAQTKAS